jgi:hypothetical protein
MKMGILFLSVMLLSFGCDNNDDLSKGDNVINMGNDNPDISLTGTKWKLTTFVNASEGTTKTPETFSHIPYDCYWIQFNDDNTCEGRSSSNLLPGRYSVDSASSEILITVGAATEIAEKPDGEEFIDKLNRVHTFVIQESSLMLYHNEKDYLLFDIYDNEKE